MLLAGAEKAALLLPFPFLRGFFSIRHRYASAWISSNNLLVRMVLFWHGLLRRLNFFRSPFLLKCLGIHLHAPIRFTISTYKQKSPVNLRSFKITGLFQTICNYRKPLQCAEHCVNQMLYEGASKIILSDFGPKPDQNPPDRLPF